MAITKLGNETLAQNIKGSVWGTPAASMMGMDLTSGNLSVGGEAGGLVGGAVAAYTARKGVNALLPRMARAARYKAPEGLNFLRRTWKSLPSYPAKIGVGLATIAGVAGFNRGRDAMHKVAPIWQRKMPTDVQNILQNQ
jgi:hypothetical protein